MRLINFSRKAMSYKNLLSYQNSAIIYDFTVEFCSHYVRMGSRTRDQMEQAARSCKQNIVEGTSASRTSSKSELKLVGVARASLDELLEDYSDYLRQHNTPEWSKDSAQAKAVRALVYVTDKSYETYRPYMRTAEGACNAMICLINQTNYLLDKQINVLEANFIKNGGYTEKLFYNRLQERKKSWRTF